jgi:hypothetical protein
MANFFIMAFSFPNDGLLGSGKGTTTGKPGFIPCAPILSVDAMIVGQGAYGADWRSGVGVPSWNRINIILSYYINNLNFFE